jgi:bleomycin hydrolase
MKKIFLLSLSTAFFSVSFAQVDGGKIPDSKTPDGRKIVNGVPVPNVQFNLEKTIAATPVKDQAMTGTCWCFASTSLIESQGMKKGLGELNLSEMFTVRNIYFEKAKNYLLRQGHTQFGEGGLGHDMIRALATYGAMPEDVYTGLKEGQTQHNHQKLVANLKHYLDSVLAITPLPEKWMDGYKKILDTTLGVPPAEFVYSGKKYTPKTFATEVLKFNAADYVNITSFTHHPYYEPFVLEVPDNFSNGLYYNLPLEEMIQLTKDALSSGYSVLWDADVSNRGFQQRFGMAVRIKDDVKLKSKMDMFNGTTEEEKWNATIRQQLYENLTTQDDHLMHITGLEKTPEGKNFFLVKNSWGDVGPYHGYINVSESYFAINTISLIVPKAALSKALLDKLKIKQ